MRTRYTVYVKQIALVFIVLALLVPGVVYGATLSTEMRNLLLILLEKISHIIPPPVTQEIVWPTRLPSVIKRVNPAQGRSGSELTLVGTGFSASNTVHTIFGSYYGIPSNRSRTEIKFIYRYPPVNQSQDEALAILKTWGITPLQVEESAIQKPPKSPSQEVLIYVENEYGSSNVLTFIEELQ